MPDNTQAIKELERRIKGALTTLPTLVGNEVVNFSKDRFRQQGWLGNTFEPWPARKSHSKWGKTPRNKGRAILVDTGRLRRSIRIIRSSWDAVVVGSDVPYAKAHNEGVRLGIIQQVKSHTRKVTKVGIVKKASLKTKSNITYGRVATGGTIQVKAHKRRINQRIPRRQFLGNSQYLTARLKRTAIAHIMKATNSI